jgi:hypothetical protein
VTLVLGAMVLLGVLAGVSRAWFALAILIYQGTGLLFEYFLVALVVGVMLPVATRAIVLDALTVRRGLTRAYQLLLGRTGRVLACWGLMVVCQIAYGIVFGLAAVLVALPLGGLVLAAYAGGHLAVAIVVGVVIGLVVLAVLLVASAAFAAFFSSFWTLAYRRLEAA